MKILIVGGGGREHALAYKIRQSTKTSLLYCAPGNAGIASIAECVPVDATDIDALLQFALKNSIDLTVVGPELPLTLGIVDAFEQKGLRIFGPCRLAARLEGSKRFAKELMNEARIPTAGFAVFTDLEQARDYVRAHKGPLVVKADGLAAGKGVFPCRDMHSADQALLRIMHHKEFGDAGATVVIEEFLEGEEASFMCLTDGTTVMPLPSSQDHKPVFDGDAGPNTGGMGAYSPAPVITPALQQTIMEHIMYPLVSTLSARGIRYRGVIYAGLMIDQGRPMVLEFNVRFGDPEAQPVLLRLQSDLVDLMNAAIDGTLSEKMLVCDPRPAVCVVLASEGYPGSYPRGIIIKGLHHDFGDTMIFHAGTSSSGRDIVTSGGRVLGVTARGSTIQEAITTVYAAVKSISWEGVHYRTDIARKALLR